MKIEKYYYKGIEVTGSWFTLGDSLWLLTDSKSRRATGLDAIPEKDLVVK